MKKVIILMTFLMVMMITTVSLMIQGCDGKIATLAAIVVTSTPTLGPQVVANFETGSAIVNPNLYNSSGGSFLELPSGNIVTSPGANGTNYAANIKVTGTMLTGYNPYEIQANLTGSGVYNLSGSPYCCPAISHGIEFYWKTGTDDTMAARWFVCPVPEQIPAPVGNGDCTGGGCYDTYKLALTSTAGNWVLVKYTWSQFAQAGWGAPQVGPLSGSYNGSQNLSRILYFQWEEDPNGASTPTLMAADFWLDEIQLY